MLEKVRRYIVRNLLAGLLVVVPIVATWLILWKMFNWLDDPLGKIIEQQVGKKLPGLGIIALVILLILVGFFTKNFLGKKLVTQWNKFLTRIPVVNKIYTGIKEISEVVFGGRRAIFDRVVLFEYPRKGVYVIGFVTSDTAGEVQKCNKEHLINIFLPTTPNPTSGYLLFVPERDTTPLKMSVEEGMRLVISAGAVVPGSVHGESDRVIEEQKSVV